MAGNPLTDPNWASDFTETIIDTVDKVRDRTTKPIVMVARGLVFGLLSTFLGLMALVLLLVGLSRALINVLEWPFDHDSAVWISHIVLGSLLCLAGAIFMVRRQSKESI
jgi:predicted lysophospholipase L1 biosynthesis ABC-type transport system permease subunit